MTSDKKLQKKLQYIGERMKMELKKYAIDIKFIDGRLIEDVVKEYQETANEDTLLKIIKNYSVFRNFWTYQFVKYCDNNDEAAGLLYDEIIWRCADKFDISKALKDKGRAFNAYVVSTLMNQLKNHFGMKRAQKAHPRVGCPICGDTVYQIDGKHLQHIISPTKYRRMFPRYPMVSTDGLVTCPISGKTTSKISESHLNKINGSYSLQDFEDDYPALLPKFPLRCPATYMVLKSIPPNFSAMIKPGYTDEEFLADYPDFAGIVTCPFTGNKVLAVTQDYLDDVLKQRGRRIRYSIAKFKKRYPNATLKAKQVEVKNPYTNNMVPELTPEILADAGTTVMEHLEQYATILLDEEYPKLAICPFTGKGMKSITKKYLEKIGRTPLEFYKAVCEYPLQKWQVKCACCDEYVDNIWSHLAAARHTYSQAMSMDEFLKTYGTGRIRATVSTNSFFSSDTGDSLHVADLLVQKSDAFDPLEIEDSLNKVARDELDTKIAMSLRRAHTLEDICVTAAKRRNVRLELPVEPGKSRVLREQIRKQTGLEDFDFVETPEHGARQVEIMTPGRDEIRNRLIWMLKTSDLELDLDRPAAKQ